MRSARASCSPGDAKCSRAIWKLRFLFHPGGGEAISAGGSRIGVMEIILADVTIRVDASVEEGALRRVLTALGR